MVENDVAAPHLASGAPSRPPSSDLILVIEYKH